MTEPDTEYLARWLHHIYEQKAGDNGWDTQDGTSVDFSDLPEENRETMLAVAGELLDTYDMTPRE